MTETTVSILFENSIVFSVLFGGVWLIKRIFRKYMSARLHYMIWAVVIIKLLIPFSVSAPWSPAAMLPAAVPQATEITMQAENDAAHEDWPAVQPTTTAVQQNSAAQEQRVPALSANISWAAAAFYLWLAGVAVYALWLGHKSYQLQKAIRRSGSAVTDSEQLVFMNCKETIGIRNNVRLMAQNILQVPAATGLIRPVVLVPLDYSAIAMEHVYMHELAHIKRGDIAVVWGLNLLRALYWFNPLVWVCFKLIQRDMEADCDGMAVAALGTKKLSDYIETVLYFAGKDRPASLRAAMSINDGCSLMKQRIRSMFMIKRTKVPTKIAVGCLAAALAFAAFTSGCGAWPVHAEQASYISAEQWHDDNIGSENVLIKIDAQVLKPDKDAFAVYETHRAGFSQQQIDKMLTYIFKNQTFYSFGNETQRKSDEIRLDALQKQYDKLGLPELEEEIEWIKSDLANRPADSDLVVSNGRLVNDRLDVWADLGGGRQGSVCVMNKIDNSGANPCIQIDTGSGDYFAPKPPFDRQADGLALTPAKALSTVQAMLDALRFYNIKPRYVRACNVVSDVSGEYINGLPGAYNVICVPNVDGLDAGYAHGTGNDVYTQESIQIFVNDSGIVKIEWLNHWENGAVTDNVTLLPFEDIKRVFKEKMTKMYEGSSQKELAVGQVMLELARVKAGDVWRLVPAWCFYNASAFTDGNETIAGTHPGALMLCINAVDGSVIE